MKKIELLSPAGDWPSLRAAISSGADAIYFGVKELNMRAAAKNFLLNEIKKVVKLCHENKAKAYATLNTIIYDDELGKLKKVLNECKKQKVDGIIAWDFSAINECLRMKIPVIVSTQASISNSEAAKFFKKLGVKRITLARECSIKDIANIKKKTNIEIETFIHGAMCISVSGRCFLSQELFSKSANRGECIQPCRREYLIEEHEDRYKLKIGNHYILSPKDLCALPFIDTLIDAGVDSLKIEGRNRSPEYVKTVTSCYREAIDACYEKRFGEKPKKKLMEKLEEVYNRGFSTGFYYGMPTSKDFTDKYGSKAKTRKEYIGKIKNFYNKVSVAEILVESGELHPGDEILIIGDTTGLLEQKIDFIKQNDKETIIAGKGKIVTIKLQKKARINDKVYKIRKTGIQRQKPKKVLVFGTFDLLHPGHIQFLKEAKKYGNHLTVVVARDKTVKEIKGKMPKYSEYERLAHVKELGIVDEAMLGNESDKYEIIEEVNPEMICLGYDQKNFTEKLEKEITKRGLEIKIVRLKPYQEKKFKSSKLKQRIKDINTI